MWAVWKLGLLLAKAARSAGPGRGKKKERPVPSFKALIETLGLKKPRAIERQRIGAMPERELEKALAAFHKNDDLATISGLLHRARPYWYQASRKANTQPLLQRRGSD
jgi:hypothetical protein